jgi:hypothetical protein
MFFEVLRTTYHSPITIESLTYRVLIGMRQYSSTHASFGEIVHSITSVPRRMFMPHTKPTSPVPQVSEPITAVICRSTIIHVGASASGDVFVAE